MGRGRSWPGQVGYTYTHGHSWFQRRKQIILEERERERASNSIQNLGVRFGELYVLLEESAKWLTKKWLNLLIGSTFCHSHSVVVHSNNLSVYGSICLLVWFLLDKTVKPKGNISVISKPITSFSKLTWLNLERGERHTLRDASALWRIRFERAPVSSWPPKGMHVPVITSKHLERIHECWSCLLYRSDVGSVFLRGAERKHITYYWSET